VTPKKVVTPEPVRPHRAVFEAAIEKLRRSLSEDSYTTFPDVMVSNAIRLVKKLGIEDIEEWIAESIGKGRPQTKIAVSVSALFVAMGLAAIDAREMLIERFTKVLYWQISDEMRSELGLGERVEPGGPGWDAAYQRVRRTFHAVASVMDPSPNPKNRILTKKEFKSQVQSLTPEFEAEAYRRLDLISNRIVHLSFLLLPRYVRRRWKGSGAIDATPVPLFSRGTSKRGKYVSVDPDGGWYVKKEMKIPPSWSMEATLFVCGPDDYRLESSFPRLCLGMALHRPGEAPDKNAMRVLNSMAERGLPVNYLAADRNYFPKCFPENLQIPARALGWKLVFDYNDADLGKPQVDAHGIVVLEGSMYCSAILKAELLCRATIDFRDCLISKDVYTERLRAREAYEVLVHDYQSGRETLRLTCRAAGGIRATVQCENKPNLHARPSLPIINNPPKRLPTICSAETVRVEEAFGLRWIQDLRYGTDEWHAIYSVLRQCIEGYNGIAKDGAWENLRDKSRRRVRGIAAQTLFVAVLIFAANLRKIERFLSAAKPSAADRSLVVVNKQRPARKRATEPKFRTRRAVLAGTGRRALD